MKLSKIEFTNFRCFRSEAIDLDYYTSLVGPNNCGKSTALRALTIFFGGNSKNSSIVDSDFYIGLPKQAELKIRFEFRMLLGNLLIDSLTMLEMVSLSLK